MAPWAPRQSSGNVFALGIQDPHLAETGGNCSVGYGGALGGLAFAAVQRASEEIVAFAAESVAGVPELDCIALVGHIAQHLAQFAVFDLSEGLAAELEVVSLLIDAPTPVPHDVDAVFDIGYQFFQGDILFPGLQ